jgi:hypothetical protein
MTTYQNNNLISEAIEQYFRRHMTTLVTNSTTLDPFSVLTLDGWIPTGTVAPLAFSRWILSM